MEIKRLREKGHRTTLLNETQFWRLASDGARARAPQRRRPSRSWRASVRRRGSVARELVRRARCATRIRPASAWAAAWPRPSASLVGDPSGVSWPENVKGADTSAVPLLVKSEKTTAPSNGAKELIRSVYMEAEDSGRSTRNPW